MALNAARKATLYHQLAVMLEGGLDLLRSLRTLEEHPPSHSDRAVLSEWRAQVEAGTSADWTPPWLEPFEQASLEAGRTSGRLGPVLYGLSNYWATLDKTRGEILRALAYPVFLLQCTVAFAHVRVFLDGHGVRTFLLGTITWSIVLWALLFLAWTLATTPGGARLLRPLPFFGGALRDLELMRFVLTLRLQLEAGVPILSALPVALSATGDPRWDRQADGMVERLREGEPLASVAAPLFRSNQRLASVFATGAASGRITEGLQFAEAQVRDQWRGRIQMMETLIPKLVYFIALGFAAWMIVSTLQRIYSMTPFE